MTARLLAPLGRSTLMLLTQLGGLAGVLTTVLRRLVRGRLDGREWLRAMVQFGEGTVPIVMATAAFTGMIMVLQGAVYVERYGVYDLVGWFSGFTTFREVGPVLIGLMFSGRVGASHTSELATMKVNEQLDALRCLAIDVYELLVVPRTLCMVLAMGGLVVLGDLVAVLGGAACAHWLMGITPEAFVRSLIAGLSVQDFLVGLYKALVFGLAVAVVASHFGLRASGGATGVGRAVNAQVVVSAIAIFALDFLLTRAAT